MTGTFAMHLIENGSFAMKTDGRVRTGDYAITHLSCCCDDYVVGTYIAWWFLFSARAHAQVPLFPRHTRDQPHTPKLIFSYLRELSAL